MLSNTMGSGKHPTEMDFIFIETELGITLPDYYKAFLIRYNGGRPREEVFPIVGFKNNPTGLIHTFFGINVKLECDELLWNYLIMIGRIPRHFLPIADDNSGDLICLSLSGDDKGCVFFWDWYDERPGPDPGYENVYKIADSFEEFLESLHEYTEE